MTNKKTNKELSNDVTNLTEKTSFELTIYQQGEYIKQVNKQPVYFEAKKDDNFLTLSFEIDNKETLNYNIGRLIDLLVSDEILNKAINKKRFVFQLDLCFELNFKNQTFDGTKFFKVKPNFFNSRNQLTNFAKGFTLFLASISGLYRPFSYVNLNYSELIDGDKTQLLQKDYEKINAKKFLYSDELINELNK